MPDILAILDTETTGLKAHDRVCEIAIALLNLDTGCLVAPPRSTLIHPGMVMPPDARSVHGITDAMLASAPSLAKVWPYVLEYVGGYPVVAHNAEFDRRLLRQSLRVHGLTEPAWSWHCSKEIARRVIPGLPSYRLQDLADTLPLVRGEAHRALGDVETLCALLLWMRRKCEAPGATWGRSWDAQMSEATQP